MNITTVRNYLQAFDFKRLFVEELGWDNHRQNLLLEIKGQGYDLAAVAEKRGMVAFVCAPDKDGRIPLQALRRKIEHQVAQTTREHIIIYTDAKKSAQVWQWVRREKGKPVVAREVPFYADTSGDLLIQKLRTIKVELEEENELTLVVQTGRAKQAFDVDSNVKRFYDKFKTEHARFVSDIQPAVLLPADREWYASVMLNRLMFLYFVQRKGFLASDENYLRNRLKAVQALQGNDKFFTFYRQFLMRLFLEGLGQPEHSPELEALIGNVPYLNGGLFTEHAIERKCREQGIEIQIEDAAFNRVFTFFDEFDWHLDNRPNKTGKEINPDVLGYIFEKYINYNEAGQKENGAYYTKEDITEYISRSTILPYLLDTARDKCRVAFEDEGSVWHLLQDNPDKYIFAAVKHGIQLPLPPDIEAGIADVSKRGGWNKPAPSGDEEIALPTEIWREVVARRQRCEELRTKLKSGAIQSVNDLITYNLDIRQFVADIIAGYEGADLIQALWRAIKNVRVLDPTVGSGAFLFAALNILEPLYEQCLERMETFVGDVDRAGDAATDTRYRPFRDELAHVNAPQHSNRAYFIFKSIIVNNLFGVDIMEEATEICKLRLFLKLVAQVEPNAAKPNMGVEPLPDVDFNIRTGNTLVGYVNEDDRTRLWTLAGFEFNPVENLAQMLQAYSEKLSDFRKSQLGQAAAYHDSKEEVERAADLLRKPLDYDLISLYSTVSKFTKKPTRAAFQASHAPLHWFFEFPEVMAAGGFDVIIGNPPYVEYKEIVSKYQILGYDTLTCADLYAFTIERINAFSKVGGRLGVIVPLASISVDKTASLRKHLLTKHDALWHSSFGFRPSKLFEGVNLRLTILLGKKANEKRNCTYASRYMLWSHEERACLFAQIHYIPLSTTSAFALAKIDTHLGEQISIKIAAIGSTVNRLLTKSGTAILHYHRSPLYWIRAMDFEPFFKSDTKERSVHHFRDIHSNDAQTSKFIGAVLNSNLFFFQFVSKGNCRNLTSDDVGNMPIGMPDKHIMDDCGRLFDCLMEDYRKNSQVTVRYNCEYQTFYPSFSKPIIDEIDRVLATHYGFTEEELDFILNYDIKYRMGRESEL